ncbi:MULTISPECIES: 50S ribosomal protein L11 methyltransferase [unclassified Streptomyces]|uniref:50S ribosomal protein L11 methyltransferase n=1 Tax=unclassified Streptomyces TaxID=2593676 RepID=UPI00052AC736|nr:50S ribosomal protein L11 methyltransferase [Streptomyces sp. CCM_MD2014]AIV36226.1 methyltransferase [Streptomyces sp. CCM_MD2014]
MSNIQSYIRSLERSRASLHHPERPRTFTMADRTWDLLDGVFAPPFSPSTGVAMDLLGLTEPGGTPLLRGSLLEIGCGTGIIAVSAALAGCDRVTAVDVSEQAVRNTALNAHRHHVTDRVTAVHSDLFGRVGPAERFDTVYWHSNFVLAPPGYRPTTIHERAYVDPGYRTHRRYLAEAALHAAPGGRVLLHFSDRGDIPVLHRLAEESGRRLRVLRSRTVREGAESVEHILYEITGTANPCERS